MPAPREDSSRGAGGGCTDIHFYRFERGLFDRKTVDGVLPSSQEIAARADSVFVDAIMGQADALDGFAMGVRVAAAREKTSANAREKLLQDFLAAVTNPEARAELAARFFSPTLAFQWPIFFAWPGGVPWGCAL